MLPLAIVASYLLGSVPFAVVVTRLMRLPDPRQFGSGNPGATNVLRSGSRLAAALTLIGDAGKGAVAVALAGLVGLTAGGAALCGLAAFAGHAFSVFLRLRGGKGVATACGVLWIVDWRLGATVSVVWLAGVVLSRTSSIGALAAATVAPAVAWWLVDDAVATAAVVCMSLVLILRHRGNIQRLLDGTEPRFGGRRAD